MTDALRSLPVALSIVTPVYRAEAFLAEFHRRASAAARHLTPDYELVFVNDASPDGSLALLCDLQRADPRMTVVDLASNCGQAEALRVGLTCARGELTFPIDDDLEEDPEWLPDFHRQLRASGADIVIGVQPRRRGGRLQRLAGDAGYFFMRRVLGVDCLPNVATARLMTRRYKEALLAREDGPFDLSLSANGLGLKRATLPVTKKLSGKTSYNWRMRWRFLSDYIVTAQVSAARRTAALAACAATAALYVPLVAVAAAPSVWSWRGAFALWLGGASALTIAGLAAIQVAGRSRARRVAVVRNVWPSAPQRRGA